MYKRVYIVGASSSGKTTLAKRLAKKIRCKHYDLDDFFFLKKYYKTRSQKEIEKLVKKTIRGRSWVIEGSYSGRRWVKWIAKKADILIWMDKPSHILAHRIIKREYSRPKPHAKHSRIKGIYELLKFLVRYKFREPGKIHKKLAETHPRGYILKTNKQINDFIKNLDKNLKS